MYQLKLKNSFAIKFWTKLFVSNSIPIAAVSQTLAILSHLPKNKKCGCLFLIPDEVAPNSFCFDELRQNGKDLRRRGKEVWIDLWQL